MQDFIKNNYHTHTMRCQHAFATERELIESAIRMGIKKLGFSDHIPCPYTDGFVSGIRMKWSEASEYVGTIRNLAKEYKDQIEIFVGFEAEYLPEFFNEQMSMCRQLGVDYVILGQHFIGQEGVDPYMGNPTDDADRLRNYVETVIDGMRTGSFKYLAHPDLMNYQGMDSVYEWEMQRLCQAMKILDLPVELNVLGMEVNKHYPNEKFWEIAGDVGVKVILGMDAHCIEHMEAKEAYAKCMEIAKKYNLNVIEDLCFE